MQISAFQSELTPILRPAGAPGVDRAGEGLRVVSSSESDPSRSNDAVEISPEARDANDRDQQQDASDAGAPTDRNGEPLSEADQREVEKLQARDQEVRTHEQAHVAAAGSLYRGGPTYSYRTGPDGNRYAVGGSVQIDTSEGSTPEETISKAQQIRRAALAPAEPSSTDQSVAAKASRMEATARAELAAERDESSDETGNAAGAAGTEAVSAQSTEQNAASGERDPAVVSTPSTPREADIQARLDVFA